MLIGLIFMSYRLPLRKNGSAEKLTITLVLIYLLVTVFLFFDSRKDSTPNEEKTYPPIYSQNQNAFNSFIN